MTSTGYYDSDIYNSNDINKSNYNQIIYDENDNNSDDEDNNNEYLHPSTKKRINPSKSLLSESIGNSNDDDNNSMENHYREQYGSGLVNTRISDRENEVSFILFIL